jgi:recombination protein RecA
MSKGTPKGIKDAVEQIHKTFGDESIMRMDEDFRANVNWLSTGVLSLDLALGGKGLPLGRMIEAYGPASSGKTTMALHLVAEAQKAGLWCAYLDAEHAMDPDYAEALGVDTGSILLSQPDTGEQALEIANMLVNSGESGLIVVDSVAALTPRAEIEGEMGDAHVGLMARMMGQALRKLNGAASKNDVMILWINQLRALIGQIYGPSEVTTGGRALPFYSSVRLDVRRISTVKTDGDATSNETRVKVVKNKVAKPFKQAEFEIEFGTGVDKLKDLLKVAIDLGIVERGGAWLTLPTGERAQGMVKAKELLLEDPSLVDSIRKQVTETLQ